MSIDYLKLAKDMIEEVEGNHPVEYVKCKSQLAIAGALVDIAESLRKIAGGDDRWPDLAFVPICPKDGERRDGEKCVQCACCRRIDRTDERYVCIWEGK